MIYLCIYFPREYIIYILNLLRQTSKNNTSKFCINIKMAKNVQYIKKIGIVSDARFFVRYAVNKTAYPRWPIKLSSETKPEKIIKKNEKIQ